MILNGEVAEWLKAAASKAVVPVSGTAGSNPALSAIPLSTHKMGYLLSEKKIPDAFSTL